MDSKQKRSAGPQRELFEYANPLLARFGPGFFREVPRQAGVYLFRNASDEILYVGKAKNLRNRINSYKNARPNIVSRKVLRMLKLTRRIELRLCQDEREALLTENGLLREHRPPFNVVNTRPDTYFFILLNIEAYEKRAWANFRLTTNSEERDGFRFGVFKGRGLTRKAFQALLRLLAALDARDESFYFPFALVRYRTPQRYGLWVPRELLAPLRQFLNGDSRAFLIRLVELLLGNERIPKFIHHVITEDLKLLEEFYLYGPRRVRLLRKQNGIRRRPIAQEEIDDLLVISS